MKIKYSPLRDDDLFYQVDRKKVYIRHLDEIAVFDFTDVPDGILLSHDFTKDFLRAKKVDGVLKVTIRQPVDREGNLLIGHDTVVGKEKAAPVNFEWKTQEEIEAEKNAPKPPTEKERIEALENALLEMVMSNG